MSTLLSDLLKPALRRGGITTLPGIEPSIDQYTELIPETNRMMGSWNLDGHKIYSTSIDRYAMNPQQTTYFIGPTGDFVAPRPTFIYRANVVLVNSSPELHLPVRLLSDAEWAAHVITELPAPWPWQLYNDGAVPDSKLYLFGFPTAKNDLELFTWNQLKSDFSSTTDAVVLPPGYEDAIVTNLALRVKALYPYDAKLTGLQASELREDARRSLQAVKTMNMQCVPMASEAANIGGNGGNESLKAAFYRWGSNLP